MRNVAVDWIAAGLSALLACGCAGGSDAERETAPAPMEADAVAGAVPEKECTMQEHRSGEWTPGLSDAEKETLFRIAEDTLAACVGGKTKTFDFDAYTITDKLKIPTATFVTLKSGGRLRGCIGTLAPMAPLYRSIHDNAIAAALHDYRFRPVTPAELPGIELHISILSPIVPIASVDDFVLGEHGIIIEKGGHRAVYLPEVAVEQGWTREETLASLSEKAGMRADAWREGAQFKVFSSVALSR